MKLRDLADRLACRLDGDGDVDIVRVAAIQHADRGDLTFLATARYLPQLAATRAWVLFIIGRKAQPESSVGFVSGLQHLLKLADGPDPHLVADPPRLQAHDPNWGLDEVQLAKIDDLAQ